MRALVVVPQPDCMSLLMPSQYIYMIMIIYTHTHVLLYKHARKYM